MSLFRKYIIGVMIGLVVLMGAPLSSNAENPIVVLLSSDQEPYRQAAGGAIDALGKSKYKVIVLDQNPDHIFHAMKKVSLISPPVVIAIGNQSVLALKTYPIDTRVVFSLVVDHREALAIPESYAISMHVSARDAYDSALQLLPGSHIGVPYNPNRIQFLIDDFLKAFHNKRTTIVPIPIEYPSQLGPALKSARAKIDAIWILPDPTIIRPLTVQYLIDYSIRERLPVVGYSDAFTKAGAIFSISSNYGDMGWQAGKLAKKIQHGKEEKRLHFPQRIHRFVNLRVAKLLDITIPNQLIALADELYPTLKDLR